jgi:hypothetical protein
MLACMAFSGLEMENTSFERGDLGLAMGVALASGASLALWFGLLQVARWAAHAIF